MDHKLSAKEYVFLSSMLFGLFFGAGNLIFPVHMGQQAGANLWPAIVGFCLTGVGLPLLGIAAMGISRSEGMFDMGCKVGRGTATSSPAPCISPSAPCSPFPVPPPCPSAWVSNFCCLRSTRGWRCACSRPCFS